MTIEKYSVGIGDRFGMEGVAQLRALQRAHDQGAPVVPVWNKSFREHSIIGTRPDDVRIEADGAVRAAGWKHAYYVDADHVGMKTVDSFLASSNFFTLDVADFIGKPPPEETVVAFVRDMAPHRGAFRIRGVDAAFEVTDALLENIGRNYLSAVGEAGRTYRHIAAAKGDEGVVIEVSVDEAAHPQLPIELFFILGAIARERIPVQTIAPKFSGKFLKGVDYVGRVETFEREFDVDLAAVAYAADVFGLPSSLKVSVHTGSDKFSLYPVIHRALQKRGAGLHLKTAGTTWLEEVIGIALSGPNGLDIVKRITIQALSRIDELCKPYATVVEIDRARLPAPADVTRWSAEEFAKRLRHDPSCAEYNVHLRQSIHVAFKVAAEMGEEFYAALDAAHDIAAEGVTENLFARHIAPVFLGTRS
jgi:hypothetical protein